MQKKPDIDTSTIGGRFLYIMEKTGLNQSKLAEKCETSSAYMHNICYDGKLPGTKILSVMKKNLPEINMNWLLTGEGNYCSEFEKIVNQPTQEHRKFETLPELAFTSSAIFMLSVYCCTDKSIESAKKILTTIEEKDQFDIIKAMNNLSVNMGENNDTSIALKQIIKTYIIEVLQELNVKPENVRNLV